MNRCAGYPVLASDSDGGDRKLAALGEFLNNRVRDVHHSSEIAKGEVAAMLHVSPRSVGNYIGQNWQEFLQEVKAVKTS